MNIAISEKIVRLLADLVQDQARLWRPSGTHEPVVFRMRADPDPGDRIRRQCAKGTMVVSDANGKAICAALQPAKIERRVARVATPQLIGFDGEF